MHLTWDYTELTSDTVFPHQQQEQKILQERQQEQEERLAKVSTHADPILMVDVSSFRPKPVSIAK